MDNCEDNISIMDHYIHNANVYYEKKEYASAAQEIEYVISLYERNLDDEKTFTVSEESDKETCIFPPSIDIKQIYLLAGQIFAYIDNNKSRQCYQKYIYYTIQLESEFKEQEQVILYSFRPISTYALSDIASNSITVSNPKFMNDPFDSLFQHWATNNNFNNICVDKQHITPYIESYRYFKIRSFVGNSNLTDDDSILMDLTMWSHYAQKHEGFCIKYKFSKNIIKRNRDKTFNHWFLKKISYNKNSNKINLSIKKGNTDLLFATKSNQWEYENEIRLISYNPDYDNDFYQINLDSESCIEGIYFGYCCSDTNIELIKKILGEKTGFYFKMQKNSEDIYHLKKISIK